MSTEPNQAALRAAWTDMIDALNRARDAVDSAELHAPPVTAQGLAEGYRYLLGFVFSGIERAFFEDPDYPYFRRAIQPLDKATIDNADGVLKPEMFANVTLFSNDNSSNGPTPAVPKSAVIYEGDAARLWVAHDDRSIELRKIKIGLTDGNLTQVLNGVRTGEKVVTGGALFIDRAATES